MGSPPSEFPDADLSPSRRLSEEPRIYIPAAPSYRMRPERNSRYLILFLLTVVSTTYAGGLHYASFLVGFMAPPLIDEVGHDGSERYWHVRKRARVTVPEYTSAGEQSSMLHAVGPTGCRAVLPSCRGTFGRHAPRSLSER